MGMAMIQKLVRYFASPDIRKYVSTANSIKNFVVRASSVGEALF